MTKLNICAAIMLVVANGLAADWPGWRGPARDGHASPGSVFPQSLPRELRRVWHLQIGEGLAPPVVAEDKVFYLDAQQGKEVIHALDRNTGRELWRAPLDDGFKNGQTAPGPRCAPLVVQPCLRGRQTIPPRCP